MSGRPEKPDPKPDPTRTGRVGSRIFIYNSGRVGSGFENFENFGSGRVGFLEFKKNRVGSGLYIFFKIRVGSGRVYIFV